MKYLKNKIKHSGLIFRRKNEHELLLFERKTLFALIAISFLTLLIYFFHTEAQEFLTSVIRPVPEHEPFDGTTMPIQKIPNWTIISESERKASYNQLPSEKFISLPPYVPARLAIPFETLEWNNAIHDQIRNEKITYPVPYLGSYSRFNEEYAGSHPAVDIKTLEGTPVYAIANGTVVKASNNSGGFGYHIVIQHNKMPFLNDPTKTETLFSSYSHLSQILTAEYQVVKKGQMIGYSGSTGFATTPHLHFQIDKDSASFHPYWPFTNGEASAMGLTFVQAVNAGLGKDRAIQNTINPMQYVQHFASQGALIASMITPPLTNIFQKPEDLWIFKIEILEGQFKEGRDIPVIIRLLDNNSELVKKPKFQDRIKIELLNHRGVLTRKFLTAGYFVTGETSVVKITNTAPGIEKIILRFKDKEFLSREFEILSKTNELISQEPPPPEPVSQEIAASPLPQPPIAPEEVEIPLVPKSYAFADKSRMPFPRIEIQASKKVVVIGKPVEMLVQYFNENAENAVPPEGVYFFSVIAGEGAFSTSVLRPTDFINGLARVVFTPTKTGRIAVSLAGVSTGFSDPIEVIEQPLPSVAPTNASEQTSSQERVFADIESGSEYEQALKFLKQKNVVSGYPDNTFQPQKQVLRVEALKMIFEALNEPLASQSASILFPDLEQGAWYLPYVDKAYKESVVQGYPDGNFRPTSLVNIVEFYKMLFLASKTDINPEIIIQLPDGVKEDDWFAPYIQEAIRQNILEVKENSIVANQPMTRAEIAKALYKLLSLKNN